jgi:hypothetical protein
MALVAVPFTAVPAHAAPAPGAYDLAATGASVSARVGSVVTIRVGIRNLGPNAAPPHAGVMTPSFGFGVTLPPGTTLVGKPTGCDGPNFPAAPPAIGCSALGGLAAGRSLTIRIVLKVVSLRGRATGSVSTFFMPGGFTGPRPTDPDTNTANNTAAIVVTPVSGAEAGLPVTGSRTLPTVVVGALLFLFGAALLLLARQRGPGPRTP